MDITLQEIENLEAAISTAIKQTSLLMVMAMSVEEQCVGAMGIREILGNTLILKQALDTVDKLKAHNKESIYGTNTCN